jgi:CubicO group peptidase (beta-lactamase class C family)
MSMSRTSIPGIRPVAFALLFLVLPAICQELPRAEPASVGLSAERLGRINSVMRDLVARKQIAGAVTLVARRGKIAHFGAFGSADIEASRPMREDTIFRIASMTKPITSVAVMTLYEEGKFLLSDPVGKYIPQFLDMEVLPPETASNNYRIPAKRPITIRHLLTHTSGLTYQWNEKLGELYRSYGITHGLVQDDSTIGEKMKVLAGLPLLFHPGDRYEYGLSIDVLGALVEVWSGMTLDEFLRTRIFEPLGMKDTHFFLPEEKVHRMATVYSATEDGIKRAPEEFPPQGALVVSTTYPYKGPRCYYSGGGGLSSTAMDYARFAQMIVNRGELDGVRLLSPTTVGLMTMDQAGKIVQGGAPSFGLGFYVDSGERGFPELTSEGAHGWGGFWYTEFFVAPAEELIGVFMSQLYPAGDTNFRDTFKVLAHQAIVD